jgi:lysophospholipase L1-like esterase
MRMLRIGALPWLLLLAAGPAQVQPAAWIPTWAASPEPASGSDEKWLPMENRTVRERVRVSAGGSQIRLVLSNEYGTAALPVGAVTIGSPQSAESVRPGSVVAATFEGSRSVTVAPGARILSDPVAFPVADGDEISISLFFPGRVNAVTRHELAMKRAVLSPPGDHTRAQAIRGGSELTQWLVVTAVLVRPHPSQRVIVAFGDSIVDGDGSSIDKDRNWPRDLWRRLQSNGYGANAAVVNEGIAGNRLLGDGPFPSLGISALARFDRDALSLPGVTHIVISEGNNDVGFPGARLRSVALADPADRRAAGDLISAYRQLIERAHGRGVRIFGATLMPYEGADIPGYYSEAKEAVRQEVNRWIRTGGAFDGVIDFDAVVRDPDHPSRVAPRFASEDHLHPNDAGYQAMADAIDLAMFQ